MKKRIIAISSLILLGIVIFYTFVPLVYPLHVKGIKYDYVVYFDHAEIQKYKGNENIVKIPEKFWGRKVTIIQDYSFRSKTVEELHVSDSVIDIREGAFATCINLKKVVLGKNVKKIGSIVFSNLKFLECVRLNTNIKEIDEQAFIGCEKLKEIDIPDSVISVGNQAFAWSGIQNVTIPDTVEYIGECAFKGTEWQNNQEGFLIYGDNVLISYNGDDSDVVVPEGVKFISGSFSHRDNIRNIYIPVSVTHIGDYSFDDCKDLKVYIPDSVTQIGTDENLFITDDVTQLTFVTTSGSCAEAYAKEKGIKCEIVDKIEYPTE